MNINFDFRNIQITEFGVGRDVSAGRDYTYVPVDIGVQNALNEMAFDTWLAMQKETDTPEKYEPSEKYASIDYIFLPLDDPHATVLRDLQNSSNLPTNSESLSEPSEIFCYFAIMRDVQGRRLTAIRRATQFKGILKSHLIRLTSDALKIVEDKVFKLDSDFDLLVDSENVHILRPSGFEFVGQLQSAIMAAVPGNVASLRADISFVNFDNILAYAKSHTRAARYIASIRSEEETGDIDKVLLKRLCKRTGVKVRDEEGILSVDEAHVMGFLEVLDRRRYEIEIVKNKKESYRAPGRRKLAVVSGSED